MATSSAYKAHNVTFGNPALGSVYRGTVYTQETLTFPRPVVEDALSVEHAVAMIGVPPEHVPEQVLNLTRAHRPWIRHVRIMIADEEENERSSKQQQQQPDRRYLILFEMESEEAAEEIVLDLHGQPYTSLDMMSCCSLFHVVALQGHDGISLQSPLFASTPQTSTATTKNSNSHNEGDFNCAVCLEQNTSSVLTTVCNHSFHMDCILQCQDSPCPVCRYDHAGLNETLSQCNVCGSTGDNYVCLICGVVSCCRPLESATASLQSTSSPIALQPSFPSNRTTSSCVPAVDEQHDDGELLQSQQPPTQNLSLPSHARQHYDETLHAYALDTETQHVFDFAGQGYVDRLLQNKEDGKLVEIADPSAQTEERSQNPGLSETQEQQVVHQKLEGMATSYYTLLKSQLEQQRVFYEGRLEEIRHEYEDRRQKALSRPAELIAALKQERQLLSQRLVILQSKRNKVKEDVAFLGSMVESLEKNKATFRQDVLEAQKERASVRTIFEECLPPLQEKVTRLMLQLESENPP